MAVTEEVETRCREEEGTVRFDEGSGQRDWLSLTREVINSDARAKARI